MIREMTDYDKEEVLLLSASQSHEDQRHTGGNRPYDEMLSEWRERGLITKYDGEIVYLVEERDKEIVGYCSMSITTDGMSQMGEISGIYVKPKHRKQGIALSLLERMTELGKDRGLHVVFIWTHQGAEAAKALYEKAGYEVNVQPVYYKVLVEPKVS